MGMILSFSKKLGKGKIDMTIGSALDLFGGTLSYERLAAMQFLTKRRKMVTQIFFMAKKMGSLR